MNDVHTFSFCESFLDQLMEYLDEHYLSTDRELNRLAIVFGGRRPNLFLKRKLATRLKKSFYPPTFFSINEFMATIVRKREKFGVPSDLESCYLLYQLAIKLTPKVIAGRQRFAQFLPWAKEILAFIESLDLENIDDQKLKTVESVAQIGYEVPADLNELLSHIVILRQAYHQEMFKRKQFSRGLQYLRASQISRDCDFTEEFKEFDQILICNFFYFNRCEEEVIKKLRAQKKAVLFFQGDQRKWQIFDRMAKNFSCPILEGDEPQRPGFQLKIYEGFDSHSQVGIAREILKKIKNPEETVIVLPTPDLVTPLVSEISHVVKDFNISMGYPLQRSSLYSLFTLIFKAQLSKRNGKFYSRDYLQVLRHPFIKNLKLTGDAAATRIVVHKIEEILTGSERSSLSGSLFLDLEDMLRLDDLYLSASEMLDRLQILSNREHLEKLLAELHELLFLAWGEIKNFGDFTSRLENFLDTLVGQSYLQHFPLNLNIAARVYDVIEELKQASFRNEPFSSEQIFQVFQTKLESERVPFQGSPLKGLQILGLFETRSLNFENVIVLDMNEGRLPNLTLYQPLIPRDVMISLDLNRVELEEEIQRYQFMRLISSAKHVHLIYQKNKEKERSRFIEELIWEEQKFQNRLDAVEIATVGYEVISRPQKKEMRKTPAMIDFLKRMSYSASSLNTYLNDPWEFYERYVLGIEEQDDSLDEPEARHVGTFIHEILEQSFLPFLNKQPLIDEVFRQRLMKSFEHKFVETFGRSMKSDSFLLKAVMEERLQRFMDHEQSSPERRVDKILFLEHRCEEKIELSAGHIKFKYVIDRIDQMPDGTILILDYKTGSRDQMPRAGAIDSRCGFTREWIRDQIRSFQLPLYFHYLQQQYPEASVNAALYNLCTLEVKTFLDPKMLEQREKVYQYYLCALDFIMNEILDPQVPFAQDG